VLEEDKKVLVADKEALEHKVEEDAPKVGFYDQFANKDGLYTLQNAGRALQQRPNKFIQRLKEKYLFYQGGVLTPYQRYVQQGIFEIKITVVDEKSRTQAYITPKGLQVLAKWLGIEIEDAA
jgi:anti-repressor protein